MTKNDDSAGLAAGVNDTTGVPASPAPHVAHTPGPWEVQDDEAHYYIRPDVTGWLIASVYKDALLPQSKTGGYPQANAHLIAAAPDYHEAMAECLKPDHGYYIEYVSIPLKVWKRFLDAHSKGGRSAARR